MSISRARERYRSFLRQESRWAAFRMIAVLALAVGLVASQVLSCAPEATPNTGKLRVLSVRELYPKALAEASLWRPDAFLVWADVTLRRADSIRAPDAAFAFNTRVDPTSGLLVYVSEANGGTRIETEEAYSPARTNPQRPIELDEWRIDSTEALEIALANGGQEFLGQYPEADSLFLRLEHAIPYATGRLQWRAVFSETFGEGIWIMIDPLTAEVLETRLIGFREESEFIPVGDGSVRVPSVRDASDAALAAAQAWRPDAALYGPSVTFQLTMDPEPWSLTFHSFSPTDTANRLEIGIREGETQPEVTEATCLGPCTARAFVEWEEGILDSTEAVKIALKNGGREYILRWDRAIMKLSARLRTIPGTETVAWEVNFSDETGRPPSLLLYYLDPLTGEIISITRVPEE